MASPRSSALHPGGIHMAPFEEFAGAAEKGRLDLRDVADGVPWWGPSRHGVSISNTNVSSRSGSASASQAIGVVMVPMETSAASLCINRTVRSA